MPLQAPAPEPVASTPVQAVPPVVAPAAPVSNLVLPVAEEPVALVPDLEPKAPPVIPERPVVEMAPVATPEAPKAPVEPAPTPRDPAPEPAEAPAPAVAEPAKPGFFARLKQGLSKTSASIGEGMASLFWARRPSTTTCSTRSRPVC